MSKLLNKLALLFFAAIFIQATPSTDSYEIKLTIKGYEGKEIIIANHYGDKQYVRDTARAMGNSDYVFKGSEPLKGGMYIAFLPDVRKSFEFLVSANDQNFTLSTDIKDFVKEMKIKDSDENKIFYEFLNYLNPRRQNMSGMNGILDKLKKQKSALANEGKSTSDVDKKMQEITDKMEILNKEVLSYQDELIKKHPTSFTARIINVNKEIKIPDAIREDSLSAYYYYRDHYFDNVDFSDERLLRSPLLLPKVKRFLSEKVTIQAPDSVKKAVDVVLKKAEVNEEIFKYFLIQILNQYAKTKIVCMDAVYVHIVENYYMKGKAPWIDEEQLTKITEDAMKLKPLLCGKIAPNVKMQTFDPQPKPLTLHGIQSEYTVLFFWAPDCGHCKKSMPDMVSFYDEFKHKGVEVFAVCTKAYNKLKDCTDAIEERDMGRWLNVVDPYMRSRYKIIYDVQVTPIIYILDKKKEIIAKKLGADQLKEVMGQIIKRDKDKAKSARQ